MLAIQEKALVRVKSDGPDTKLRAVRIRDDSAITNGRNQPIELRTVRRPDRSIFYVEVTREFRFLARRDTAWRVRLIHDQRAAWSIELLFDGQGLIFPA